jgi:hypothetical protein
MGNKLSSFVKGLKTPDILALYNLANYPETPVKRFATRMAAEARLVRVMAVDPAYFYKRLAAPAAKLNIHLPVPEGATPRKPAAPAVVPVSKRPAIDVITDAADKKALQAIEAEGRPAAPKPAAPAVRAHALAKEESAQADAREGKAKKKQITSPHLNLRCPECGYYAKSTMVYLAIARLACPVSPKHGPLLTADERGEKRGR